MGPWDPTPRGADQRPWAVLLDGRHFPKELAKSFRQIAKQRALFELMSNALIRVTAFEKLGESWLMQGLAIDERCMLTTKFG